MSSAHNLWQERAVEFWEVTFGSTAGTKFLETVPGRVNLLGEHIDYHLLPVLPMAINRGVTIAYRANERREVRAISTYGRQVTVSLGSQIPGETGDWVNYIKAAVNSVSQRWAITRGLDAALVSNLPVAAGLSSSSAVMIAFVLALLRVNDVEAGLDELMAMLPEAEHFVGTRGGGMDHAAIMASREGCALHLHFSPLEYRYVRVPAGWRFLVAHSMLQAEKSGALRAKYNRLKEEGLRGLAATGCSSFREVQLTEKDKLGKYSVLRHVVEEAARAEKAVDALNRDDLDTFGALLAASHTSMRNLLEISTPAIDELVKQAEEAGAAGARLTGAGFGGCVLVACSRDSAESIRDRLAERYYAKQTGFDAAQHLFFVEPSSGALIEE